MTIVIAGAVHPNLLDWMSDFAARVMSERPRSQMIDRHGSDYLARWYLSRKAMVPGASPDRHFDDRVPPIPSEVENLYIHRYGRPDADEPHCHPWPNATLVVSGWFDEACYDDGALVGIERRNPGDVMLRRADEVHAIVDLEPGTVTLFATLPKQRDWGFHTAAGFIPWHQFREWKEGGTTPAASPRDARSPEVYP